MKSGNQKKQKLECSYRELFQSLIYKFATLGKTDKQGDAIPLLKLGLRYLNAADKFIDALLVDEEEGIEDFYLHQFLFRIDCLEVQIEETTGISDLAETKSILIKLKEMKFNFDPRELRPTKVGIAA